MCITEVDFSKNTTGDSLKYHLVRDKLLMHVYVRYLKDYGKLHFRAISLRGTYFEVLMLIFSYC